MTLKVGKPYGVERWPYRCVCRISVEGSCHLSSEVVWDEYICTSAGAGGSNK